MKKSAIERLKELFLTAPKPMSVRYMAKQTDIPEELLDLVMEQMPFTVVYRFVEARHQPVRRLLGKPKYIPVYYINNNFDEVHRMD